MDMMNLSSWRTLPHCPNIYRTSIGDSAEVHAELWLIPSATTLAQHCVHFETALQIVSCGSGAKIGYSEIMLDDCRPGLIRRMIPSEPLMIRSDPKEATLIIRALVKNDNVKEKTDKLIFADHEAGRDYALVDGCQDWELVAENYYDGYASGYRKSITGLGFFMPAIVADILMNKVSL